MKISMTPSGIEPANFRFLAEDKYKIFYEKLSTLMSRASLPSSRKIINPAI
jgi:hypothetical protein